MPKKIIHLLEAVEIEAQHGELTALQVGPQDLLLQPLVEQGSVGQPCQWIVVRKKMDLLFVSAANTDITNRNRRMPFAGIVDRAGDHLDGNNRAAGMLQRGLHALVGASK